MNLAIAGFAAAGVYATHQAITKDRFELTTIWMGVMALYFAHVAARRGALLERIQRELLVPLMVQCEREGKIPPGTTAQVLMAARY